MDKFGQSLFGLAKVVTNRTAALLRGAGIEMEKHPDATVKTEVFPQGGAHPVPMATYAPAWAVAICMEEGVNERLRMNALRRAARDRDAQMWIAPLLGCLKENKDRVEAIESFAREVAQTLYCRCGAKFVSAVEWKEHLEEACPKRQTGS